MIILTHMDHSLSYLAHCIHVPVNAGFTVLSLFVPMLALVLAFVFVGTGPEALPVDDENTAWNDPQADPKSTRSKQFRKQIISGSFLSMRIVVGGILVGGTVALMHYCQFLCLSYLYRLAEQSCLIF